MRLFVVRATLIHLVEAEAAQFGKRRVVVVTNHQVTTYCTDLGLCRRVGWNRAEKFPRQCHERLANRQSQGKFQVANVRCLYCPGELT